MSKKIAQLNKRNTWQEVIEMDTNGVTSNFYMHFATEWVADIYRERPVFERLKKVNPNLVKICLESHKKHANNIKSGEHYQTIFPAYKFMEQNVLLTDAGVTDKTGKVDKDYLFR